jgi:putative membrane protein
MLTMMGMMGLGLLLPIVLILILAYALGWLPQRGARGPAGPSDDTDPLEILRQRYARGEIDQDEFERMRQVLRG